MNTSLYENTFMNIEKYRKIWHIHWCSELLLDTSSCGRKTQPWQYYFSTLARYRFISSSAYITMQVHWSILICRYAYKCRHTLKLTHTHTHMHTHMYTHKHMHAPFQSVTRVLYIWQSQQVRNQFSCRQGRPRQISTSVRYSYTYKEWGWEAVLVNRLFLYMEGKGCDAATLFYTAWNVMVSQQHTCHPLLHLSIGIHQFSKTLHLHLHAGSSLPLIIQLFHQGLNLAVLLLPLIFNSLLQAPYLLV